MAGITIELSEYVIDAIADAVVKKMQEPKTEALDKIRAEIEQMPSELTVDGRRMIRRERVFRIIDNYRTESEVKE